MDISEESQFDSVIGGNVEIPQSVAIKPFIRARMDEIEALTQLIETPSSNILLKHQFPKHMRRRAMSQNVKRIPRRLREHQIDMREKSGIREVPIKRPRRKYRRRPQNLLSDYNRRQKKFVWLENHIWHAKRFHMIEKWGYKLPHFPNDKSFRACYRATSKHCLIQDISFYCCIELSGSLNIILQGLRNHTSNECGLTFDAQHIQFGNLEGSVMFFASQKYPFGAIGEIKYIWQPPEVSSPDVRVLWLWSHPSYYEEVVEELIKTFEFELERVEGKETSELMEEETIKSMNIESSKENVESLKLDGRNVPFFKTPKYHSKVHPVVMILLKDTLNRFRLTGPLSQALITSTFRAVDLTKRTVEDWCYNYKNKMEMSDLQLKFWEKMKNISDPGQLPSNSLVGLIAIDPRFTMPAHKEKALGNVSDMSVQSIQSLQKGLSYSPLWQSEIRDEVTSSKLSTHQLNELRSAKLVPGMDVEYENPNINDYPAIPCLFIQRPGTRVGGKPLGYSSGWDIIVPAGYGQPVWLGLVMHGGQAGGLKETESITREAGMLYLPPDTSAGKLEEDVQKQDKIDEYFRLPPAKRTNYIKLGFVNPFHCPWNILINDWTDGEHKTFFVLRNKRKLLGLKTKMANLADKLPFELTETASLIAIMLILKGKGNITKNANICLPSEEDLKKLKEDPNFKGPVEKHHKDNFEKQRKLRLNEHKQQLRRLSRKRHKERKKENDDKVILKSDDVIAEHAEAMKRLWLPECTSVKDVGCRRVIGFVTSGDFSFTNAKSSGTGYICLKGLLDLFKIFEQFEKNRYVLIRNSNTDQYRFASISIIC